MRFQYIFIFVIVISLGLKLKQDNFALDMRSIYGKVKPQDRIMWSAACCLREFLGRFLGGTNQTPLFIATGSSMPREMNLILMTMIDSNMSTYYVLAGNLSYNTVYSSSLSALILVDNPETLMKDTQSNLLLLCSGRCLTYIVILSNKYNEDGLFQNDAGKLVQLLWKRKIGNVAVAGYVKDNFFFAKSQYFEASKPCIPQEPKILGACTLNGYKVLQMSQILLKNIQANRCSLKARYISKIPYAFVGLLGMVSGVEGEILSAVSKLVNFNYKSSNIYGSNRTTFVEVLEDQLEYGNGVYFVFGGIPQTTDISQTPEKNVDFTYTYDITQIVWILPVRPTVSMFVLTNPMSSEIWICLALIFVASLMISPVVFPKFGGFLELTGLLLGVPISFNPITISYKIFVLTWATMGYVLSQFYLASLAKNLLIGDTSRINNVKDLISSNLKLVADTQLSWVYATSGCQSEYEYDNILKARLVYKSKKEIEAIKTNLLSGKIQDTAILMSQNFSSAKFDLGDYAYQMHQIIASYPLALATWKGMPMLTAVDESIATLVETGFVTHWSNKFSVKEKYVGDNWSEKNVGLSELYPAFLLLLFGCSFGFFVLVLEILLHGWLVCGQKRR